MHHCNRWRMKDQLDVTCYFISILMCVFVLQAETQLCCASACNTGTTQNQPHQISNTQRTENKTTDVVIQQHSRKLLMMDILMSETCWTHKKWNKIASDIKLVFHSWTITMMHGPINISNMKSLNPCWYWQASFRLCLSPICFYTWHTT